jgi:PhnB protein
MPVVTPHITVSNAAKAIDFYKQAFGAEDLGRHLTPDGRIMHASIKIGDSPVMLNDEFPEWGGCRGPQGGKQPFVLHIQWDNVNQAWDRAVNAGAKITMPLADQFWGDRYGQLEDPFGYIWSMGQRVANPTAEEVEKKGKEMFTKHAAPVHQ